MDAIEREGDFHTLVAACAGQSRQEQEKYLVRLIMKFTIERYGRDPKLPDGNFLRQHGMEDIDVNEAERILDACYLIISKALLHDDNADLYGIRQKASEYMRSELERRRSIQKEAGIQ